MNRLDEVIPLAAMLKLSISISGIMVHTHELACYLKHGRFQTDEEVEANCKIGSQLSNSVGIVTKDKKIGEMEMTYEQGRDLLLALAREIAKVLE